MADMILRNLDDALKDKLRQRAAKNVRSMSEELREIVREALSPQRARNAEELKRLAAEIRALSADRPQTPSEILVRETRDEQ